MSPTTVSVFAPAKVNLTLHITGQREDGYHLLDSLVAFATVGDHLRVTAGNRLSLTIEGPESEGVPGDIDNLAMRAAALVESDAGATLALEKCLPSASGIGGGSADAAAAYRGLLAFLGHAPEPERILASSGFAMQSEVERILTLGADIPMCLMSRSARVCGVGERMEFIHVPPLPAVLINPRVPVSTPAVFRELATKDNPAMPDSLPRLPDVEAVINWLSSQRNDLESPAIKIAPVIGEVLRALHETEHCGLARMSGSGATCFGLYANSDAAKASAEKLSKCHPDWWVVGCMLGDQSDAAIPRVS